MPRNGALLLMSEAPKPTPGAVAAWRASMEAHRDVMDALTAEFRARHELSISDFDVLINIAPHEAVRHRDLAGRVVLSRSALSRLIDRLIARGLLSREKSGRDSRGVLITLTPAGQKLREEARRSNDAIVTEAFAVLAPDEINTLHRLAVKLTQSRHPRTEPPPLEEQYEEIP